MMASRAPWYGSARGDNVCSPLATTAWWHGPRQQPTTQGTSLRRQSLVMNLMVRRTVWLDGENRPNDYTITYRSSKLSGLRSMRAAGQITGSTVRIFRGFCGFGRADSNTELKARLARAQRELNEALERQAASSE